MLEEVNNSLQAPGSRQLQQQRSRTGTTENPLTAVVLPAR